MSPRRWSSPLVALALLSLIAYRAQALNSNVDFTALCQEYLADRLSDGTYNQSQPLAGRWECGASYDETTPPALSINISLPVCLAKAAGYQKSHQISQWGTPLIAFLLPAVAFILTVGRPRRLPKFEYLIFKRGEGHGGRGWAGKLKQHVWPGLMLVLGLLLTAISLILDTLLWGIIIFVLAGPLIAGSSFKAINDFRILRYLRHKQDLHKQKQDRKHVLSGLDRYMMAITLVGTFKFHTSNLGTIVKEKLQQPLGANQRLLHLVNQVPSFGIPIFGPVLFFIGAFVEGLYDAKDKKGDNDTANAIAFGIWYGVIVVVAIFAAATIGVEDPFTIENVFGGGGGIRRKREESNLKAPTTSITKIWHWLNSTEKYLVVSNPDESKEEWEEEEVPFAYFKSPYVTVWIGERHIYFREWIDGAKSFPEAKTSDFYRRLASTGLSRLLAFFAAIVLVGIPCGLAASTSYFTPPASPMSKSEKIGFGCRSVTVLTYFVSQLVVIIGWLVDPEDKNTLPMLRTANWCFISLAMLGGAFAAVGGTIMQLVGVYRNCICKAGLRYLVHHADGTVELATDTQLDRDRWIVWWSNGIGALSFFSCVLILACFYNMWMKENIKSIIEHEKFEEAELEVELKSSGSGEDAQG